MSQCKGDVLAQMRRAGLVAVIRAANPQHAIQLAQACLLGGVDAIEITFTVPGAESVVRDVSSRLAGDGAIVGAGTVLDEETARIALLAGARFIVSPCLNKRVAAMCNRYCVPYIPGAMTLKEVVEAMEAGADIVKIFPGELFGPRIVSAFMGPLPHASLMPTGGVTLENVGDWVSAGAVAVGIGGGLTGPGADGDYPAVTQLAREFISRIQEARAALRRQG